MLPDTHDEKTSILFRYLREQIPNFCMDEKMQKALSFRERLEVFYKNKSALEPIGKYFISVESPRSQEFLVQVFLSMTVNSQPITSRITSSATKELHCIEEKKYECFETNTSSCEKNVYIGYENDGYFVKVMQNGFDDGESKENYISHSNTTFISDGCSILLMRYLAMTDFSGTLCLDLITIEGNTVNCDYECSSTVVKINGENIKVFEIIQTFRFHDTISSTIKSILSKQGNLLSIDSPDSSYEIKINSCVDYCIHHQKPINLPLRNEWKEDFELISKHSDKKSLEEGRKRNYWLLHSEISELLSDYIQSLLCKKPDDVLDFTIDYFKILSSKELQKN